MSWQLVVESGQRRGQVVPILRPPFVIGREPGCNLRPVASNVSRRHCSLENDGGRLLVVDHWATNGTFVNGRRIEEEQELHPGDRLRIGPLEFLVRRDVAPPVLPLTPSCKELTGSLVLAMTEEENASAPLSEVVITTLAERPVWSSQDTRPDLEAVGPGAVASSPPPPARAETAEDARAIR